MELTESLDTINNFLRNKYGIDTITGQAMYRVVLADEQYEKRETKYTDSGIEMLYPEVRELPKYQWLRGKYILEHLVLVPIMNMKELAGKRISYEILHAFQDKFDNPLPPACDMAEFAIDCVLAATGRGDLSKYKPRTDPEDPNAPIKSKGELGEHERARIDKLHNQLFGDESGLNQATINSSGPGIIVPANYRRN